MVPKEVSDDLVETLEAMGDALFADLHQLGLGHAEHVEGSLALVGGASNGRGADGHESTQEALVLDDLDVFFNDRPARQTLGERGQVGDTADGLNLFIAGQFVGQGDDCRLAVAQ